MLFLTFTMHILFAKDSCTSGNTIIAYIFNISDTKFYVEEFLNRLL